MIIDVVTNEKLISQINQNNLMSQQKLRKKSIFKGEDNEGL